MSLKRLIESLKPAYYSTGISAWNNMAGGPGKTLLSDSGKVACPDGRQPKPAQVNLEKSIPKVNPVYIKKEDAFVLISKARELIKNWEVPSPATMKLYTAAIARLRKSKKWPEDYAQSKKSYYVYRAAVIACTLSALQNNLVVINRLQKRNDPAWLSTSSSLHNLLRLVERYAPDQEKTHLAAGIKSTWNNSGKKARSTAKRKGIGTLPPNWRAIFWKSFPDNSPYRLALAVMSATGCRPSELEKGIQLELDHDGNLVISIEGTKTHEGRYGQEYRQLTLQIKNEETRFLENSIQKNHGQLDVTIKNAKALSEAIRRHSKKLWPRRKYVVSPYSFRHQFAADLKNDHEPAEVAMAMGHSVCKTQQYYGMRNQGQSGKMLCRVTAEKMISQVNLESPLPRYPSSGD